MSRARESVLLILTLALGCAGTPRGPRYDRDALPRLPASHALLSLRLPQYARDATGFRWTVQPPPGGAVTEVAAADAPRLLAEARAVLAGQPTPQAVLDAWADLAGACRAHLLEACTFLRDAYRFGSRKAGPDLALGGWTREEAQHVVVVACTLGREGRLRGCRSEEQVPERLAAEYPRALEGTGAHPAQLAGHPVDFGPAHYVFGAVRPPGPVETQLARAAARAQTNPRSALAWTDLAALLAEHRPEGADLDHALERLQAVDPSDWWAHSEHARRALEAGDVERALQLADAAWGRAPFHPYVVAVYAAAVAASGRCDEATAEQRRALELLPEGWPDPERERFRATLARYEAGCTAAQAGGHAAQRD